MTSRERTFLALQHKAGDRIPVDFWASSGMLSKIESALGISREDFLDKHDVDLRYIEGPRYIGPQLADGEDIWGVKRTMVKSGNSAGAESYSEVMAPPLAGLETVEQIENYAHWPSADWFDYSVIESQCEAVLRKNRIVVFMGDRTNRIAQFKPAMYVRGTEDIFVDLAAQEDIAVAIFRKIREFYLAYLERILESAHGKIDIILTGDDFGGQENLLVSRDMWLKFLQPGFADYNSLIKSHTCITMHHTCGSVAELIPDMIVSGLDVLQSCQPEAAGMSLADLKARYGKRICFQGGISIQKTMPFGKPDDVRKEVKAMADIFRNKGGYIFCTAHNIQSDTSVENVLALLNAYKEFGRNGQT